MILPGGASVPVTVTMDAEHLSCGPLTYTGTVAFESNDPLVADYSVPVTFITNCTSGYQYLPGDANMFAGGWQPAVIGADVTFLVNYFRAAATPCFQGGMYAPADVNGDCNVFGSDVTYLVGYFRGMSVLHYCPAVPTVWPTPAELPATAPAGWPNCE